MVFECSGGIWFLMCVGGGDGECCDEVSVGVVYGGIVVFLQFGVYLVLLVLVGRCIVGVEVCDGLGYLSFGRGLRDWEVLGEWEV